MSWVGWRWEGTGWVGRPRLCRTSEGVSIGESDCVAPLHRRQDSHGIIFGPRKVASYFDVTGPVSPPLSGDKVAIMLADPSNCRREDQGTLFLSWNLPRLQSGVSRAPASLMLIVLTQCTAANEWVTKGAAPVLVNKILEYQVIKDI